MDKKTISIIIPTYNGKYKVIQALKSLARQVTDSEEVIVVIDGSTDGTLEALEKESFDIKNLLVLTQENGGRAQARNRGADEAKGYILIFLDDDMLVPSGWIEAHREHHINYPNSLVTGILTSPPDREKNELFLYQQWLNKKWTSILVSQTHAQTKLLDKPYISANNFSISKDIFFSIGCFDYRLNDLEDKDLAITAIEAGYELYVSSKAEAFHCDTHSSSFLSYVKRLKEYEAAYLKLVDLKPVRYKNKKYSQEITKNPLKLELFKLFARLFWLGAIDKNLFVFLPKLIRFKLYDVIITAHVKFNT